MIAASNSLKYRFASAVLLLFLSAAGCGGSRDESISGVTIPVPKALIKSAEKPVEISLLGLGAGRASYHGVMDSDKVIEFYKKEMAARGWQPAINLVSGGAVLAYSKEGKSVLISIGKQNGETVLTLTVGGVK